MVDRDNAGAVLRAVREGINELFVNERIAAGIVHDMVARLDPDLVGADRVVGRGWRSALQVQGLLARKDDEALWQAMYGYYRDVCANTQSLEGGLASFEVLFQADEDTSIWSPDDVAAIMQVCRAVPTEATPTEVAEEPQVQPQPELSQVETEVGPEAVTEVNTTDEPEDTASVETETQTELESESEPVADNSETEQAPAEKETPKKQQQQPRRRRRRRKPGKPRQKTTAQKKMRQAPEREMSEKTAADGVIQPVDLDFRIDNAEYNEEIMPYIRSEVHADAAHIKGTISGVHLYLSHIAFDLLDEGMRARGVAHNLGLGSALSALLIAVLPLSNTQHLKLSPMMEEAVDVMRAKLNWSASEYLIDISESMDKAVGVLLDLFSMTSHVHQETQVNSYVNSLNLAERVGATNLPVGIKPEHIEVDNVAAQEIARRVRARIMEDEVYAAQREQRSTNFYKSDAKKED